ncbi:hypothetical protein ACPXAM_23435, partial [Escherichia coli]|uniref:hypothetical protein n=2 Tax=Gammaproteobacteria TaxID=1236 RepID=UPI003CE4B006
RGLVLWNDIGFGQISMATGVEFLTAGTRLYPWIWTTEGNAGATGNIRGMESQFRMIFLAGA